MKTNLNNNWDYTTDVLVIGTGFAGLSAAIEAKKNVKDVLVIEKMNGYGGNSIISDGGIAAPQTKLQEKYGITDSQEVMYQDMLKAGMGINNPELLRILVSKANESFQWTVDELQVPYLDRVDIFGGHSIARCYTPENITGATIIKKMIQHIDKLEIPVKYRVSFQSFITDEAGKIIGVSVYENYNYKEDCGDLKYIKTNRGVVLATGGYGADVAFRQIQDPRLTEKIGTTNKPFATAEALRSALSIGASTVQLSQIQLGPWSSPDEKGAGDGPLFADYILFPNGVIVDPVTAKRFVNELADRKIVSDAILTLNHPCIGIADNKAVQESGWDISKAIKKGVVKIFDTLEDIAVEYDMDSEILRNTVSIYNESVLQKSDNKFGKVIIENSNPIETSPYYVMRLWPKVHFTMGGLGINTKTQVIDYNGKTIDGLYAAGEVVGGVHGASRLGSCAITECIVFGRIAGSEITK